MSSPFQPHRRRTGADAPPSTPAAAAPVPAAGLAELRGATVRLGRVFVLVNAVLFGAMVLLACSAGGLLGTEVAGRLNLGMLLGLVQGVVLLGSAVWFDRRSAGLRDRIAGRLTARSAGHRAVGA